MARDPEMKRRARELRQNSNPLEEIVWKRLRDRRLGRFKFRRQYVVGSFVVDFYCAAAKLIVELDGSSHEGRERQDLNRQTELEKLGFTVLRFRNQEVYENEEGFLERVLDTCRKTPHPNPLPGVPGRGSRK